MNIFSVFWKLVIIVSMFLTALKLSADYSANIVQQSVIVACFNPYLSLFLSLSQNGTLMTVLEILALFLIVLFIIVIFVIDRNKKGGEKIV